MVFMFQFIFLVSGKELKKSFKSSFSVESDQSTSFLSLWKDYSLEFL